MFFNIDAAIFIGFLIANLILGLWSSRGVRNIKDFAVGDRNFSTFSIAATLVATWASGQAFFTLLSETYNQGLYFIWSTVIGYTLCLLSIGIFFAPRMAEFLGKLSIAQAMGDLFDKRVRVITAVAGFIAASGMIALQLKVSGFLFEYCFGLPGMYGIIIGGAIVTIYSSLGGIKSVTFTDAIQFFTFGTMIPALALFILGSLESVELLTNTLNTHELFDFKEVFDFNKPKSFYYISFFLFNAIPAFNPAFFQRVAMARDTNQVRRSFIIAAFTCLFIKLTICFIGIMMLSIKPNLNSEEIFKYILFNYSYPGLTGLILVGIMAMIMSTADSYLNSTSVLFINDFCKPLSINLTKNDLTSLRLLSLIIGVFSIILALQSGSLVQLIITTNTFYMPIVTVPFILAMLGFRSSSKSVLIGMGAGFITVVIWDLILKVSITESLVPGMINNLVGLIGSHYLLKQPGGWIGIKNNDPLMTLKLQRKIKFKKFIASLVNFNVIKCLHKNSPNNESSYVYYGLYCMISLFSNIYSIPKELQLQYPALISFISPTVLFLATALLSYPLWLRSWKEMKLISIVWNFIVFYILICIGFVFVIISNFAPIQLMIFMVNLILIAISVRWQWALFIIIAGLLSTIQFLQTNLILGDIFTTNGSSLHFKIIYMLVLFSSMLIIFFKPKQEYIEETEHKVETLETEVTHLSYELTDLNGQVNNLNEQVIHYSERVADQNREIERLGATTQKILNNVNHELRLPIGNVMNFSDMLHEALEKTDNKFVQILSKEVYDNSNRVSSMILNMLDLATLDVKKIDLQKKKINLSELVEDRVKTCRKIYLRGKKINFVLTIEPEIMVSVDPNYLRQTVDNLVINAINFSHQGLIKISLFVYGMKVIFTIADEGIGIPALELSDIFTPFKMGSNTESKAQGRGVGLALCKSAIEAHGGSILASSNGEEGATFTFKLPL